MGIGRTELVCSDGSFITRDEIFERVTVLEPGILRFHEVPHGTPASLELFNEQIQEQSAKFGEFVLIVDLSAAAHPDPDYREAIVDWMRAQTCFHQCFVQPNGSMQRVALRFMLGRAGISVTVHADLENALEHARELIASRRASPSRWGAQAS